MPGLRGLHANCSGPDGRVPGDKIDDEVYDDEDSTNSKMWQGSLPHKNLDKTESSDALKYHVQMHAKRIGSTMFWYAQLPMFFFRESADSRTPCVADIIW